MKNLADKQQSKKFAESFTDKFIRKRLKKNKNLIILLEGKLGAGKTQMIKWIAKSLGIKETIQSPTFTLWKIYPFNLNSKTNGVYYFHHIDLYRLKNAEDIFNLGLKERFKQPGNLFLIEWGERILKFMSEPYILFKIEILDKLKRKILIVDSECKTITQNSRER